MQKKVFVIGGIVLVLVAIVLFGYVFFIQEAGNSLSTAQESEFSTLSNTTNRLPLTDSQSNTLSTSSTAASTNSIEITDPTNSSNTSEVLFTDGGANGRFTQLTTSSVAGMSFIQSDTVRYSETGTGQLYDLNLTTFNLEYITTRLSGVISATFNQDGSRAIFTINDNLTLRFFVGIITQDVSGEKELRGSFLPLGTTDAVFTGTTNIRYLLASSLGGEVHTYEPSTRVDKIESIIPLSQAYFVTSRNGDIYLATRPSAHMEGALYRYTPSGLHVIAKGNGLTAYTSGQDVYVTAYRGKTLTTTVIHGTTEERMNNLIVSDTCTQTVTTIFCARPDKLSTKEYPDAWYRGEERHNDALYSINTITKELSLVASPEDETGQIFDVLKLVGNPQQDTTLLLINKNNGTLWMFRE